MGWYNILGNNKGSISHILWIDPISEGYILLTNKIVALKRVHYEPILILKITEWMKFVDFFGLSIETDLSKVGKLDDQFFRVGYIPITSYGNPHIERKQIDKQFILEPPNLRL